MLQVMMLIQKANYVIACFRPTFLHSPSNCRMALQAINFHPHTTTPTSSSVGGSASRMCESLATPNLQGYDLLTAMQSAMTNNDTSNTCLDGSSLSGSENLFLVYSGLVDAQVTNTGTSQAWQYQVSYPASYRSDIGCTGLLANHG